MDWLTIAGSDEVCGLRRNGTLWCWRSGASTPQQVGDSVDWQAVGVGEGYKCGLKMDGTAWCSGMNLFGQLGDGTTDSRLSVQAVKGLGSVVQIFVGGASSCALKSDDSLWCWGSNQNGQIGGGSEKVTSPVLVRFP